MNAPSTSPPPPSATQRDSWLRALGLEPMQLRAATAAADSETVIASDAAATVATSPVLFLWSPPDDAAPLHGPYARLAADLLQSLGVRVEQVGAGQPDAMPSDVPILVLGAQAPADGVRLPALARLRDPLEKRIAWPILRRLRRRLREGGA